MIDANTITRRDREIILDTTIRLYTARLPFSPQPADDTELLSKAVSDAFELSIPILYASAMPQIPTPGSDASH